MIANEIKIFRRNLLEWYRLNQRPLPWRQTSDPYSIWVSEVMLQQTQVQTVVPYYHGFIHRFPDVQCLAAADLQDVLKCWEGLGYYGRARNLHHAANTVMTHCWGTIPDTLKEFRQLKGVGEYIAAAVMSIAFGYPHAVVDGNVKRVLARLYMIDNPVNQSASHKVFRHVAETLLDTSEPGIFNQAIMELGALVCKPVNPECSNCPVCSYCKAWKSRTAARYPKRVRSKKTPEYHIAVGVVRKNGRILITQRKTEGLLGGLWEFPGGKVKNGESAQAACVREIAEETGLTVCVDSYLTRIKHAYTHFKIAMDVFICTHESGRVKLSGPEDFRWIKLKEIKQYPFPGANHKFIPLLRQHISS